MANTWMDQPYKKKVKPKVGVGRPKGSKDRSTANARDTLAALVEQNSTRLQGWLDRIAHEQGPQVAFKLVLELLEYHIPKLARHEVTGADQGPVALTVKWQDPPVT